MGGGACRRVIAFDHCTNLVTLLKKLACVIKIDCDYSNYDLNPIYYYICYFYYLLHYNLLLYFFAFVRYWAGGRGWGCCGHAGGTASERSRGRPLWSQCLSSCKTGVGSEERGRTVPSVGVTTHLPHCELGNWSQFPGCSQFVFGLYFFRKLGCLRRPSGAS